MTPPSGNGRTYQLVASGVILQSLKQLLADAADLGLDEEALQAMKTMRKRLIHDPLRFGEPLYHLQAMKLEVRLAIIPPLSVQFAVHQEQPIVYLKSVAI